jgi:hypothetical protein
MARRERGARGPIGPAPTGCLHCGLEPSLLRNNGLCYYAGKMADLAKAEQPEPEDPDGWQGIHLDGWADVPVEPHERAAIPLRVWRAAGLPRCVKTVARPVFPKRPHESSQARRRAPRSATTPFFPNGAHESSQPRSRKKSQVTTLSTRPPGPARRTEARSPRPVARPGPWSGPLARTAEAPERAGPRSRGRRSFSGRGTLAGRNLPLGSPIRKAVWLRRTSLRALSYGLPRSEATLTTPRYGS